MFDIDSIMKNMTDAEKIGQLFMIGIAGREADPSALEMVGKYGVGGIILFARNIADAKQAGALISKLRSAAKYPPAFAVDQEGGLVIRLVSGATVMPGNMAIAACPRDERPAICAEWGEIEGRELREAGFTLNLAPVLDINSNPQNPGIGARSFSDDPALCAELGSLLISAVQKNGVSACAKHFPGKGNAAVDAHLDLPSILADPRALRDFELVPFRSAIKAGVDAVMTAHVVFTGIPGETLPATLSHGILTGLLKNELGFAGPVITDDMEMGAIARYFPQDEACFRSFMAGADILLICHTKELQIRAIELFKTKLGSGELPRERLDDAVRRILTMKSRFENHSGRAVAAAAGSDESGAKALDICRRSITAVSDASGALARFSAAAFGRLVLFEPRFSAITQVEDVEERSPLYEMLSAKFAGREIERHIYDVKIDPAGAAGLAGKVRDGDFAVVVTYNGHLFRPQIELANAAAARAAACVVAAVRNPYDLALVTEKAARIATYGFRKNNLISLFELISGSLRPAGTLPVSFGKVSPTTCG